MAASSAKKSPEMDLGLECHLNWVSMDQASPAILESTLEERDVKWVEMSGNQEGSVSFLAKFEHLASQVVFAHWTDNDYSAKAILDKMEEDLQSETGKLKPEHLVAYQYLIEANRAVLTFRMGAASNVFKSAAQKASLYNIENPKSKALILSMKAGLIGFFGNTQGRIARMRKVIELDPDVPEYLDAYFRALRKLRREMDYIAPPSDLEVEIMEKAYALAPESPTVLQGMTTLYYDIVKKKLRDPQFTCKLIQKLGIQDFVSQLKSFASLAAKANPGSAAAGIQFAEILSCGPNGSRGNPECEKASKEQYLRCMRIWPRDSNVLHKVGKYLTNSNTSEDFDLGVTLIGLSLKSEHGNFPAFMDYLRLISRKKVHAEEGLDELLDIIEYQLPFFLKKRTMCSRIYCLKASLLAKKKEFEQAVEFWLKAVSIDPELFTRDTTALLGKGVFRGLFNGQENQLQASLVKTLDDEPADSERREKLKKIINALEPGMMRRSGPYNNGNGNRPLSKVNAPADEDSNWRKKSTTEETPDGKPAGINGNRPQRGPATLVRVQN